MSDSTLDLLGQQLAVTLSPLVNATKSLDNAKQLMKRLGYELPPGVDDIGLAAIDITSLVDAIRAVDQATPAELEDELTAAALYAQVLLAAVQALKNIATLAAGLPAAMAAVPDYLTATDIVDTLPRRLLDLLIVLNLEREVPELSALFFLLGFFEQNHLAVDATKFQPDHVRTSVEWERIPLLFTDPEELICQAYGWNTADFNVERLMLNIARLVSSVGATTKVSALSARVEERFTGTAPPSGADPMPRLIIGRRLQKSAGVFEFGTSVMGLRPSSSGATDGGIGLLPYVKGTISGPIPIPGAGGILSLVVDSTIPLEAGIALHLRGGKPLKADVRLFEGIDESATGGRLGLGVAIGFPDERRVTLFNIPPGIVFDFKKVQLVGGGERDATGDFGAFVELKIEGGRLGIGMDGADSFLTSLIPIEKVELGFDFMLGFSPSRGLYFGGSASIETAISLNLDLGPIALDTLHLGLSAGAEGLGLETSFTGRAALGPLGVSVERVGVITELAFTNGNLGPVDLRVPEFRPPTGLGITVEAGPITGGGYLSLEPDKGRYAGILELEVFKISITAIGLLDTQMEDGSSMPSPGFSFLMIVAVEFQPIQLGYGFALNGVGGLAGINRSFITEALLSGLRSGSLDHIMFPEDPVRNAPQIISNLRPIFPVAVGRYVFGPMAIIGWGIPTLFRGEIGVVIVVPSPLVIAILGQLSAHLPAEEAAIVEIHLDVVAIIDFGRKLFSLDASLRDSYIAAFSIYGDMAMRICWGDPPSFALSVGGLNPNFDPPPNFPTLRRVGVSLGAGDNPRITIEGYLAVTSNSLQFGARAELYAAAGSFNVRGWLGFDALFIFVPFSFRFDFTAGLVLRMGSSRICGIEVNGTLTGPNPFHVWGKACVGILFWDVCVPFDAYFGNRTLEKAPKKDAWPALEAAIEDQRNWSAGLPSNVFAAVGLLPPAADGPEVMLHPMGTAVLRQKEVPFNVKLETIGEAYILGATRYDLKGVEVGDESADWSPVKDYFAPGSFQKLSATQKLTRPSYEKFVAGAEVGSTHVEPALSQAKVAKLEYETKIVDSPWDSRPAPLYALPLKVQQAKISIGAKAKAALTDGGRLKFDDGQRAKTSVFGLDDEVFVIAGVDDLQVVSALGQATTITEAEQLLNQHLAANPGDRSRLQVVAAHEVESAA